MKRGFIVWQMRGPAIDAAAGVDHGNAKLMRNL